LLQHLGFLLFYIKAEEEYKIDPLILSFMTDEQRAIETKKKELRVLIERCDEFI
jgi:hypothetical protein